MSEKEILPESENPRREFMQKSLLHQHLPTQCGNHLSRKVDNPQKSLEPEVINEVDILVVGSGSSVPRSNSGRPSRRQNLAHGTNSQLGGTTTTGGVPIPDFSMPGENRSFQALVGNCKRKVELDGGKFPDFSKVPRVHHHNQIHINQFLYSILGGREMSGSRRGNCIL